MGSGAVQVGSGAHTWKTGPVGGANGVSVYEVVAVVTANGTRGRRGFFLSVLLRGGTLSSVESNTATPIAST